MLIAPSDPPSLRFFFPLFPFSLFFLMNDASQHNSRGQYQRHYCVTTRKLSHELSVTPRSLVSVSSFPLSHFLSQLNIILFRETDNVRMVTSLALGMLIDNLPRSRLHPLMGTPSSFFPPSSSSSSCKASPKASLPPPLASQRQQSVIVAAFIDHAIFTISIIQVFNAAPHEHSHADAAVRRLDRASGEASRSVGRYVRIRTIRRDGHVLCIPQFIVLAKEEILDGFFHFPCHVHTAVQEPPSPQEEYITVLFPRTANPSCHLYVCITAHHPHPLQHLHLPPCERNHIHCRPIQVRQIHRCSAPFEDVQPLDRTHHHRRARCRGELERSGHPICKERI